MNKNYDRYAKYFRDNHRIICKTPDKPVSPLEMWGLSGMITNPTSALKKNGK